MLSSRLRGESRYSNPPWSMLWLKRIARLLDEDDYTRNVVEVDEIECRQRYVPEVKFESFDEMMRFRYEEGLLKEQFLPPRPLRVRKKPKPAKPVGQRAWQKAGREFARIRQLAVFDPPLQSPYYVALGRFMSKRVFQGLWLHEELMNIGPD